MKKVVMDEAGMFDESKVGKLELQYLVDRAKLQKELEETLKSVVI